MVKKMVKDKAQFFCSGRGGRLEKQGLKEEEQVEQRPSVGLWGRRGSLVGCIWSWSYLGSGRWGQANLYVSGDVWLGKSTQEWE